MKPNHTDREVSTSGVEARGEFQISVRHSAHIMSILRDQLYSDKVLAVLREYSANAWDAHREVGKNDVPIHVTLPTTLEPTLSIRDFGPGISHNDMFEIYAQYGESTKRTSNGQVGMLGIGSKSGFAYTDSFTITSWHQGKQRIYTALLDNDEKGTMNMLAEDDCGDETGIMIQIPVKVEDIPEFVQTATELYQFFKPRPVINIPLPPEPKEDTLLQHGSIRRGHGQWVAVMGCIAYRVNLDQLRGLNAHNGGAGHHLDRLDGQLYFNIGEVQINASREELKYEEKTRIKLINKFNDLTDEFIKHTLDKIDEGGFSFWEKRVRAQVLNDMGLPVPDVMKKLTAHSATLPDDIKTFTLTYGPKQSPVKSIDVDAKTRLIIRNEIKKIDGYGLSYHDYVVRPKEGLDPKPTFDEIRLELAQVLEKCELTGLPVVDISTIPWYSTAKFKNKPTKETNRKHQVRNFVLKTDDKHYGLPYADHWEIEQREPQDNDVFVILSKFRVVREKPDGTISLENQFYNRYRHDRDLAKLLKYPMPKIYGYKDTEKKPLKAADLKGTEYYTWRTTFHKQLLEVPIVRGYLESVQWSEIVDPGSDSWGYWQRTQRVEPENLRKIITRLGPEHPMSVLFRKVAIAGRFQKRTPRAIKKAIQELKPKLEKAQGTNPAEAMEEQLLKVYPLLTTDSNVRALCDDNMDTVDLWIDYIQLVDQAKKGLSNEGSAHDHERVGNGSLEGEAPRGEEGSTELPESSAGPSGREVGSDRGPPVHAEDGQGVVEQQVRSDRGLRDVLRAACA